MRAAGTRCIVILACVCTALALVLRDAGAHGDACSLIALGLVAAGIDDEAVRRRWADRVTLRRGASAGVALGVMSLPCMLAAGRLSVHGAEARGLVATHLRCALSGGTGLLLVFALPGNTLRGAGAVLALAHTWGVEHAALFGVAGLFAPVLAFGLMGQLPGCFSLGEACLVALGVQALFADTAFICWCLGPGARGGLACSHRDSPMTVGEVGLVSVLLMGLAMGAAARLSPGPRAPPWALALSAAAASVPVLYVALRLAAAGDPILWLVAFLATSPKRGLLLAYWLATTVGGLAAISSLRQRLPAIVVRKLFHALATCLFVPGVVLDAPLMRLSFAVAIAFLLVLEYVRMANVPHIAAPLARFLSQYTDSRDSGPLITTHIYLLVGCAVPLLVTPAATPPGGHARALAPLAGILALGVGDSVASSVGTHFGRTKWPQSSKTVEGTAAAIVAMVAGAVALLACAGAAPTTAAVSEWAGVVLATVATCLLEASTDQIDNLFLPAFYFTALHVAGELTVGTIDGAG